MNTFAVPQQGLDLRKTLLDIEEAYIDHALELSASNVAEAARLLGMNRTTLVEKLRARYPERISRRIRRNPTESFSQIDPEGEFTFRKAGNGRGYNIFYKDEKLDWVKTLPEVEAYIKEKINED